MIIDGFANGHLAVRLGVGQEIPIPPDFFLAANDIGGCMLGESSKISF